MNSATESARKLRNGLRRISRVLITALLSGIVVMLAFATFIALVGMNVDATRWRGPIERLLGEQLGRTVQVAGALRLQVSLQPRLEINDLLVANPQGFAQQPFARLGFARLELDLRPMLYQRRLLVRALSGTDLQVQLLKQAGGAVNWHFAAPQGSGVIRPDSNDRDSIRSDSKLHLDFESVHIERLAVSYESEGSPAHFFDLDRLDGRAIPGEPVRLNLHGRVEKQFPYQLAITAGSLAGLSREAVRVPVEATLEFAGTTLTVDGHLWRDARSVVGTARFGIGTPDLQTVERLLQVELPKVGATALAGEIRLAPGELNIDSLVGSMGQTTLSGALRIEHARVRPRISGALRLPTLDMRPFLKQTVAAESKSDQTLSQWYRDVAGSGFSLDQLTGYEADIDLAVEQWLSLPGDVRQVSMKFQLGDGRLTAPLTARVEGVTLSGELQADAGSHSPGLSLALDARDSPLGGLGRLLFGLQTVQGHLGSFHLRAQAQGRQVATLVETLDVQIALARARLSYGREQANQRPVAFSLDWFTLGLPAGARLQAHTVGELIGQPFEATLDSDTLPALMQGRAPIHLQAHSRTARAQMRALLDDRGGASDIAVSLDADRITDVAAWLNLRPRAERSFHLSGKARWAPGSWSVSEGLMRVGETRVRAQAAQGAELSARIDIDVIDPNDIEAVLPSDSRTRDDTDRRLMLEIPVLPAGIDLSDADLQVSVGRVVGHALRPTDLQFNARMRSGQMLASPFSVTVLDVPFTGALALDLRGSAPTGEAWVSTENLDLGRLLRELKLAEALPARIAALRAHLQLNGRRLGDLLSGSRLVAEIEGGTIALRDANTQASLVIAIAQGSVRSELGAPVQIDIDGALGNYPVKLAMRTAAFAELLATDLRVPFAMTAESVGNHLEVRGSLARSFADRDAALNVSLRGNDLQTLSGLARAALPHWGPYALEGELRLTRAGYELPSMKLAVGNSRLSGKGQLQTASNPPKIEISLTASQIQLDDFPTDLWQATDHRTNTARPVPSDRPAGERAERPTGLATPDNGPVAFDPEALRTKAAEASRQAQQLLSPVVLGRQDAVLEVRVDEVLSGRDRLGNARLSATIKAGRAEIGPIDVTMPGGTARGWLAYQPSSESVSIEARLALDRFDYGVLARRVRPQAELSGRVSVDLDIRSKAPSLAQAMRFGSGTLDFIVWPENLQTGIVDLWAANLIFSLAQRADPSSASKVNCAIGRFNLTNGLLEERQILLDTTRVRVEGRGRADFRSEELSLNFRPYPKQAQFFSLATPLAVGGTFTKPEIGTAPGAVFETAVRLGTSLVWVPLQKLLGNEVPADGRDLCPVAAN